MITNHIPFVDTIVYSTRMIQIQSELTKRCIELLCLPPDTPCHLLDVGCGSGLSGEELSELGHTWIGMFQILSVRI